MRLKDMYTSFLSLTSNERLNFIRGYREDRETDIKRSFTLERTAKGRVKTKSPASRAFDTLTEDELAMAKRLGITVRKLGKFQT